MRTLSWRWQKGIHCFGLGREILKDQARNGDPLCELRITPFDGLRVNWVLHYPVRTELVEV